MNPLRAAFNSNKNSVHNCAHAIWSAALKARPDVTTADYGMRFICFAWWVHALPVRGCHRNRQAAWRARPAILLIGWPYHSDARPSTSLIAVNFQGIKHSSPVMAIFGQRSSACNEMAFFAVRLAKRSGNKKSARRRFFRRNQSELIKPIWLRTVQRSALWSNPVEPELHQCARPAMGKQ